MGKTYKPGERAPASGQYEITRNGKGISKERTITKNEPFPPTPKPGDKYKLTDLTKH